MRPGFLVVIAACVLVAGPGSGDEFKNPHIVEIRAPGGDLTMRARRGTASIPGLGEVEQVYGYEVRRGTTFPPAGPGPARVVLLPRGISVARAGGRHQLCARRPGARGWERGPPADLVA